jgi:hypothetical protein
MVGSDQEARSQGGLKTRRSRTFVSHWFHGVAMPDVRTSPRLRPLAGRGRRALARRVTGLSTSLAYERVPIAGDQSLVARMKCGCPPGSLRSPGLRTEREVRLPPPTTSGANGTLERDVFRLKYILRFGSSWCIPAV